jgi:hypothetical protein
VDDSHRQASANPSGLVDRLSGTPQTPRPASWSGAVKEALRGAARCRIFAVRARAMRRKTGVDKFPPQEEIRTLAPRCLPGAASSLGLPGPALISNPASELSRRPSLAPVGLPRAGAGPMGGGDTRAGAGQHEFRRHNLVTAATLTYRALRSQSCRGACRTPGSNWQRWRHRRALHFAMKTSSSLTCVSVTAGVQPNRKLRDRRRSVNPGPRPFIAGHRGDQPKAEPY